MPSRNMLIPRIGIGGPVGSGKTRLIERLMPILISRGYKGCIISNDVISKEDSERMRKILAVEGKIIEEDMIIGVATGGCPHTAIREDPSINLAVIEEVTEKHPHLDFFIIESGGDNIMTTFSPALADYFIYIVDVAGGDKYPRKMGLGIQNSDLLVINKVDLAPYVGASLSTMKRDAARIRNGKPFELVNCKTGLGIDRVAEYIINDALFASKLTGKKKYRSRNTKLH
ncbi:MAG: urease accessory protein UreG [Nitrososphaeraceae archaeon]